MQVIKIKPSVLKTILNQEIVEMMPNLTEAETNRVALNVHNIVEQLIDVFGLVGIDDW